MSIPEPASVLPLATGLDLRPSEPAEFPEFYARFARTFALDVADADREMDAAIFEPERSLVGIDAGQIVCTAAIAGRSITIPGAVVPAAAVIMVTVSPTHRRRGLLTALVHRQFNDLHDQRGESIAVLNSAEAAIYGRFGYGLATHRADMTGDTRFMAIRRDLRAPGFRMHEPPLCEARSHCETLYEQVRAGRVAWLDRSPGWWDRQFHQFAYQRHGQTATRVVLCQDPEGATCGYALYSLVFAWDTDPAFHVAVSEIVAASPLAYAATWDFLLGLDLVRHLHRPIGPVAEPLAHMLTDPRSAQLAVRDGLWVRLVSVDRALAQRRYAQEIDTVIALDDQFCHWNHGNWRLAAGPAGATCERTTAPADLAMSAAELGAAYLGSTSLASLAAAGRVDERRPGALRAASRAFRCDSLVFCPENF